MTLRDLITTHPGKFYPQTWYTNEPFMDVNARILTGPPDRYVQDRHVRAPRAASLAWLWCTTDHAHPMWGYYLWCQDVDHHGQQVYIGQNGQGLEIHRHLALTSRFASPLWNTPWLR